MDGEQQASPFEQTIDSRPRARSPVADHRAVAIVEGSTPQLSHEINDLLRNRLRAASLVLFGGFLAFFIRDLIGGTHATTLEWVIFTDHAVMVVITGIVGLRLCTNCPHILGHLRIVELIVFGGSALFFGLISYWLLTKTAASNYLIPPTPMWMMLIYTYALFIPNTLNRAIAVVGSLAAAPVVICSVLWITSEPFATVLNSNPDFAGFISQTAMIMTLSAASAVWGAYTMGTLRREAFEAKRMGQYRLKEKIGEGGMGEVYLAEHLLLKRPCAIKLIRADKAGDSRALARFEREVKATAKLTHWNTVEIYDYGRADDGTFYYVMEYLPGHNLSQLVEMHGVLPADRVVHLLTQTCEALSEAHEAGLIHRDIKPGNIFAAHRGGVFDVAKLLDFGLAKPVEKSTDVSLTREGTITGSPLYMSPEQAMGDAEPDARSDIYSVGAVAYFLLTARPVFSDGNALKVMMAHARDEPVSPSQINPDVPDDLEQVVLRCLEKDPEHRFQTAKDLQVALGECAAAGSWTADTANWWWQNHGCPKKKALDEAVLHSAVG